LTFADSSLAPQMIPVLYAGRANAASEAAHALRYKAKDGDAGHEQDEVVELDLGQLCTVCGIEECLQRYENTHSPPLRYARRRRAVAGLAGEMASMSKSRHYIELYNIYIPLSPAVHHPRSRSGRWSQLVLIRRVRSRHSCAVLVLAQTSSLDDGGVG